MSAHGQTHHHVSSPFTLLTVLTILVMLTIATFAAYFFETWLGNAFGVVIPQWVNVMVAMSIATVKGVLVLMYFMHLRHDNQLNTVIFISCVLAFAIFLGFTGLDLGNRGTVYSWKVDQIIEGGTSYGVSREVSIDTGGEQPTTAAIQSGMSMAEFVKDPTIAQAALGAKAYKKVLDKHNAHAHHADPSSSEMSRPRTGLTAGLLSTEAPDDHGGHGGDHGGADHAEDAGDH